ncbi:NADH dehydrogenase subunit 3 (mitochondrion) [Schistosoma mansoni]|uniref:NADH-ubiquinone oxidoreductase chain 3 n=3 Tax=Schistosoma mansoni TaxID=6183 RepID=Q9MD44_SCHMA|nr:NADH dehydrogenase subunit 3 [Schistosoma mansoni]AAF29455.1 NADH dehydrogenase 3 [Schistosoma mansoni]AAG13167.2 NADH dehydrogenase subunit 3 [Schistosoma mansoni]|eukprot:NP_066215.2 NADH dehydrogenase subunit 3 (mitochondrion) [Schistosoma mansoni]
MSSSLLALLIVAFFFTLIIGSITFYVLGFSFSLDHYISLKEWYSSFECGFLSHGYNENFFSFSYLNLLVLFVVFDLEVSLLLNVVFDGIWFYTYWCYFFFFFFVFFCYLIEVGFGYIKWM